MSISEFNASYLHQEDRVLLRVRSVDCSEYRFLLTRRITLFLIGASQLLVKRNFETHHFREAASALATFTQDVLQERIYSIEPRKDFDMVREGYPGSQFPIGFEPVLIMDVVCECLQESGTSIFSFDFLLPGGGRSNLRMPIEMMQSLHALLDKLRHAAAWGDSLNNGNQKDSLNLDKDCVTQLNSSLH